jgi:nucleotide-binding universal stress UspA family protein
MSRSILVPLDGSHFGEYALGPALGVARRVNAVLRLALVHEAVAVPGLARPAPALIHPLPSVPAVDPDLMRVLRMERESYLAAVARRIAGEYGISATTAVLDGPVAEMLAAHASDVGVDLIVMTTHGRGGLSRLWLGSVAEGVVREANVPVLLIRPPEIAEESPRPVVAPRDFRCLVIALDGSSHAEAVIDPALDLAGEGADCSLIQVIDPVMAVSAAGLGGVGGPPSYDPEQEAGDIRDYLESVASRARARGLSVHTRVIVHTQAARGILHHAHEARADLIAMATHGRRGLRRLVLGSVPDKVLRGAEAAVLLYQPTKD